MVKITFLKPTLPYVAGESAWFNEVQAAAYIKQGFATPAKNPGDYVPAPARAALLAQATAPAQAEAAA
jgi:hypothetical protein